MGLKELWAGRCAISSADIVVHELEFLATLVVGGASQRCKRNGSKQQRKKYRHRPAYPSKAQPSQQEESQTRKMENPF